MDLRPPLPASPPLLELLTGERHPQPRQELCLDLKTRSDAYVMLASELGPVVRVVEKGGWGVVMHLTVLCVSQVFCVEAGPRRPTWAVCRGGVHPARCLGSVGGGGRWWRAADHAGSCICL